MDADRINHLDLLREVVAVRTLVDRLIQDVADHRQEMGGENGIYSQIGRAHV